ncbi:MAG TPA: hypothetical protein RWO09_03480 [Ruminococcus sp.]
MIRDIILAYQECYGLNGVKPTDSKLPEEVRPGVTTDTNTMTTSTASTTTTTTTTMQFAVPPVTTTSTTAQIPVTTTTTAPVTVPITTTTMPAAPPPQIPEPQDNRANRIG